MTGPLSETLLNAAWRAAGEVRLSVLIPFFQDDPRSLIRALAKDAPDGVDLVLFDDGRPDAALNDQVAATVRDLERPAALITSRLNRGRSAARNRLAGQARGAWLLFLDADMAPPPNFLTRWLLAVENTRADALFGGYAPAAPTRETRLHARLAELSDGLDAVARNRAGPTAVCSSNLAVRRAVLGAVPFDEGYAGWGWEDVDWALSAAERFTLAHVDNPAAHGGLESASTLLRKFSGSGPNFARLIERHPAYAARPGARLARLLGRLRAAGAARIAGRIAAKAPLPMRLRVLGLKLFRAGVNAKALSR